jgi:hypothetical protein
MLSACSKAVKLPSARVRERSNGAMVRLKQARECEQPPDSLDDELERLTPTQLVAVLDCIQDEALRAKTTTDLEHAHMGLAVVRAELLSREFDTGLHRSGARTIWWVAAACVLGFLSLLACVWYAGHLAIASG